jgi:hypothetical protein
VDSTETTGQRGGHVSYALLLPEAEMKNLALPP